MWRGRLVLAHYIETPAHRYRCFHVRHCHRLLHRRVRAERRALVGEHTHIARRQHELKAERSREQGGDERPHHEPGTRGFEPLVGYSRADVSLASRSLIVRRGFPDVMHQQPRVTEVTRGPFATLDDRGEALTIAHGITLNRPRSSSTRSVSAPTERPSTCPAVTSNR